jgi:hypothetical protein
VAGKCLERVVWLHACKESFWLWLRAWKLS